MARVTKSELKPKLFSYLRSVSKTGRALIITEHGVPVLKIVPISPSDEDPLKVLRGTVERFDEPLRPVDVIWKAAEE